MAILLKCILNDYLLPLPESQSTTGKVANILRLNLQDQVLLLYPVREYFNYTEFLGITTVVDPKSWLSFLLKQVYYLFFF